MQYLQKNQKSLVIALDDVNYLFQSNTANKVFYDILRAYEEYPGVKTAIFAILSDLEFKYAFDKNVNTVFIPQEINSCVFRNVQMLMGINTAEVDSHLENNKKVLEIVEQYTLGNYGGVVTVGTEYLRTNPSDLQIAIILCKSIICGGIEYPDDLEIQYVRTVYSIYELSDDYRDAVRDIKQTIKINHGSILSQKAHSLLKRKYLETGKDNSGFVSSLLDPVLHPNFLRFFVITADL